MKKLGQRPPKPRHNRMNPCYPRCLAALALAAAATIGCKEPEVALAGDVAPAFEPDAATSAKSVPPPPTASAPPAATDEPVMLGGVAPEPFVPDEH